MYRMRIPAVMLLACYTWQVSCTPLVYSQTLQNQPGRTEVGQASASSAESPMFGLTRLHDIELSIGAKDYAAMEPRGGGIPFGPGRQAPVPQGGFAAAGSFDFQFETIRARLTIDNQKFDEIGLRYKGNATYLMSMRQAKRSFKIDFDEYQPQGQFHGITKLNLHCGVLDGTRAREALAYSVFRTAGVAAPRTAFAQVKLTVPGKFENELLGVYTLVEQVDKSFLKQHFKSSQGLLLKPEGMRGIQYLGEDSAEYKKAYDGKYEVDEMQWKRLIDFARLINKANPEQFEQQIPGLLDVNAFARFLAVNAVLVNFDSFIGLGHNYYLYLNPETNLFVFIPWDLDLSFGSHPMFGPMDQQLNISIEHPHLGEINLIDRFLAIPQYRQAYQQEVRRTIETVFNDKVLGPQIDEVEQILKTPLDEEKRSASARRENTGFGPPGGGPPQVFGLPSMPLRAFSQKRVESIEGQLDGKVHGVIPRPAFGPGLGGPVGPGAANPAAILARQVLRQADQNQDGNLSTDELANAVREVMQKNDKNQNGLLEGPELEAAIQRLLPTPQPGAPAGPNRPQGAPPR